MLRTVTCRSSEGLVMSEAQCDQSLRPLTVYPCGDRDCAPHWVEQEWQQVSTAQFLKASQGGRMSGVSFSKPCILSLLKKEILFFTHFFFFFWSYVSYQTKNLRSQNVSHVVQFSLLIVFKCRSAMWHVGGAWGSVRWCVQAWKKTSSKSFQTAAVTTTRNQRTPPHASRDPAPNGSAPPGLR